MGALVLGFFLRLWDLGGPSLSVDEGMSLYVAGLLQHAREIDVHPPGFFALLHGWELVAPPSEAWLRLLPVLAGWLCLPALYWLARELDQPPIAPVAVLAVSCYHVQYSRELRMYPFLCLFAVLGLAALHRGLHGRKVWLALSALCFCAADWTHYFGLLIPFVGLALVRLDTAMRWLVTWGVSFLGFLPWLAGFRSPAQDLTLRMLPGVQDLLEMWGRMAAGDYGPVDNLWYAAGGLVVVGLVGWDRRSVTLFWVVGAPLVVWLMSRFTPLRAFEYKYFVWCAPALALVVARHRLLWAPFAGINLVVWAWLVISPSGQGQDWREAAQMLGQRQPGAIVLVHPGMMAAPLLYYGLRPEEMRPTDDLDVGSLEGADEVWLVFTPHHPLAVRMNLEERLGRAGWDHTFVSPNQERALPSAVVRVLRFTKGSPPGSEKTGDLNPGRTDR